MNSEIYNELNKKYREDILPKFKALELERQDVLRNKSLALFIGIVFVLLAICIKTGVIAVLFCASIAFLCASYIPKAFNDRAKEKTMKYFCSCFEDLSWLNSSKLFGKYFDFMLDELKSLKASNLFYSDNSSTFYYDDIFKGTYDNTPFLFYELSSNTHLNKFYTDEVRIFDLGDIFIPKINRNIKFNGLIIKVKLNKRFKGNTVITPDSLLHIKPDSKLKHTVFEDIDFEKKFDVFTDNEVEARYLITTSFMERLNRMGIIFDTNKVSCAFYNKELYIGIHVPVNRDLFRLVDINKPIDGNKEAKLLLKEIALIYDLIDYLKLKEKTML